DPWQIGSHGQHILGVPTVHIHSGTEPVVEKAQIHPHVFGDHGFPSAVGRGKTGRAHLSWKIPIYDISPLASTHGGNVPKGAHLLVAQGTVRSPDLEEIQRRFQGLHERFPGNVPCCGHGWEKSKTLVLRETGRTIVSPVEL